MIDLLDPFPPPPRLLGCESEEVLVYEALHRHCLAYPQGFIHQGLMETNALKQIDLLCEGYNWLLFYLVPTMPLGIESLTDYLAEKEGSDGLYAEVDEVTLQEARQGISLNYYVVMGPNGWCFLLPQETFIASYFYSWQGPMFFQKATRKDTGLVQEEANVARDAPVYTD